MDDRRYYGLDALRGLMMVLGIVLHSALLYLAEPPARMPVPTDRNNSYLFDVLFHFIHGFRMPTFFVLAGFFAAMLVDKRGLWQTYRNRAARVLVPLVVALVLLGPLSGLLFADFMLSARYGTHDLVPNLPQLKAFVAEMKGKGIPMDEPATGHFWFLYFLCMFYLLLPLLRFVIRHSGLAGPSVGRWLVSPATLVVFSLWTAITLWPFPGGQVLEGFQFFRPEWRALVYYFSFFALGYFFYAHRGFLQGLGRWVPGLAGLAIVLFPLSLYLTHLEMAAGPSAMGLHEATVLVHALCTWTLVYLFIGAALRYFDYESPWIQYLARSAFWVYLLHFAVVMGAGWWLLQFDLPASVKFVLVVGFTAAVCFLSYHYGVQKSWVSVLLNGRRFHQRWPWQSPRSTSDD